MKLYLYGHDYKYAVEQMLLTLYPQERPEYGVGKPEGDRMELRLSRGERRVTASCTLVQGEERRYGRASADNGELSDALTEDRICQRLVKNAMYRAALHAGHSRPAWGALTGVRPGKLLCAMLEQGMAEDEALRRFMAEYDVSPARASLCLDTSRHTLRAIRSLQPGDVCLYVGIPFCPTRCAYCSFVSQSVEKSMQLIEPFMEALMREIDAVAAEVRALHLRVVSIYMGGGTPTTLSPLQLERLCTKLEEAYDLSAMREYTVEAGRPDTVTAEKLRVLRRHGVDRVSVNPQTMSDTVLETIGRRHTAADIVSALALVREIGGFTVNMDLIAGLPGDTVEGFSDTLDRVLALEPENITVHTLSLKKGSRLTLEGTAIPTAAEVSRMLDLAGARLRGADYGPYYLYRQKFMSGGFENVGWARAGSENLYNICIMEELCSILAMGAGGSTKLVVRDGGRNIRLMAPKYPLEYIQSIERCCDEKQKIREFFLSDSRLEKVANELKIPPRRK